MYHQIKNQFWPPIPIFLQRYSILNSHFYLALQFGYLNWTIQNSQLVEKGKWVVLQTENRIQNYIIILPFLSLHFSYCPVCFIFVSHCLVLSCLFSNCLILYFLKYYFGVPHFAIFMFILFQLELLAWLTTTIQYSMPGFEPTTTQL